MAFYPKAIRTTTGNSSGSYTGGPFKGVLHTTEGTSASGAIGAFKSNNSWPHFLIDSAGLVYQFIDTNVAARTLRNLSGGVQTNRDSAIQAEIVGFAGKPTAHPAVQMNSLRDLMRWVETIHNVKPVGPGRPFASAYGQRNLRFTNNEWDNFNGWCGHCHVPENDHWDPGTIDLKALFPEPGFAVPESYYQEVNPVPFTVVRPQGGYIVVGADGGVFAYNGAPFKNSLPGLGVKTKVIAGAWSSSGSGYWLLGYDGAIYAFGDASYKGGFNTLSAAEKVNKTPIGLVASGGGYKIIILDSSNDGSPFDELPFGV